MFSNHFALTKRLLGVLLLIGGVAAFAAILSIDLLDVGREGGIGPVQRFALSSAVLIGLIGLTLIPLGKQTA